MATRYYSFAPGEYYHIYNRGNNKQTIFHEPSDYGRFIELLYLANGTEKYRMRDIEDDVFAIERGDQHVHVGAYSILPNHFHILLTPQTPEGVSAFMLRLGTGYSSYLNKKYKRSGAPFEGSYKAKYVEDDRHLKYLFAYIHLNPFRGDLQTMPHSLYNKQVLGEYQYSSLPEYLGIERAQKSILAREKFPHYFETVDSHVKEMREWLDIDQKSVFLG